MSTKPCLHGFFLSTAEIEDISSRLKTSRQRVGDLERSLATVNNSSQQFEKVRRPSDINLNSIVFLSCLFLKDDTN